MHLTLALLVGSVLPAAPLANLDFAEGRLTEWTGQGFHATTTGGAGPNLPSGVCSDDRGPNARKALLHRTFVVPPGAGAILFTAAVVRPDELAAGAPLDITLEAAESRFIPRQMRTAQGWKPAPRLLPFVKGQPYEYLWPVSDLIGQTVRIVLRDEDDRPGCYLYCGGFRILSADAWNGREFAATMLALEKSHHLAPMTRLDSKHFLAIGNAADEYTEERLYNCETIYALFFDHFRKKGFRVREPGARLMVAVFDSQTGFEAYLGRRMSAATTGVYHPPSNRLVVYDYAQNRSFLANKKEGEKLVGQIRSPLDRQRISGRFSHFAQTRRADANIGTIMHEVAHQLSFNGGMLNREGDVPIWLAEGLACYCEATDNGSWQGIGEPNLERVNTLAGPARGQGTFIPLRALLTSDDWLRKAPDVRQVLLGYSQSWALFRMLMEQKPRALRNYLALVYPRRTPEHRLADWVQVFGTDLATFEKQYYDYMRTLVHREARPPR